MAEVRPMRAVHYDLEAVTSLEDVLAPPYDVIDGAIREELLGRSPYNVVQVDLPEAEDGDDPYEHAAKTFEGWLEEGVLAQDEGPTIWALEQDYEAPGGGRMTRRGFLARVRLVGYGEGIRPHERTQPGPKEDRLRLTRATRHNLSPIFTLHEGPAWDLIEPATAEKPWAEARTGDGAVNRIWRIADHEVHEAIHERLGSAELLIADGHHRYETALAYAEEQGHEPEAGYVLMALVSLEDPGLTVFATHRLLKGLEAEQREAIRQTATQLFELAEVSEEEIVPAPEDPPGSFGYMDSHHLRPWRLRLKDAATLEEAMPDRSPAYRRLEAAALEELFLKGPVGLSPEDIAAKRGLGYTPDTADAIASLRAGAYEAAFFLRPTPVDQVREVAAGGETMPPKSTYFFPKLPTGIVFNPLS